ncbi:MULTISPECIES: DNA-binding protein [Pseudomonas]|uniref:Transcriptional regulator n=1 Tax=Pseudomonas poae TaxID=200451 RepID=A0AAP2RY94_9PSED|nr:MULTISPECIES: transcriptional regulator [Pseudomonas]MCF5653937.1 transcriptional regulator [Pseudomonas poae]MCF5779019.1 transcriptional regulator [Pseudomonas poae]CRM07846.1 putative transcriptional regulator [Pseudomonas sp. 25 E 4]
MALTRSYKHTIAERAQRDPEFAQALFDGEPEISRVILRDLVNATVGFEGLAKETAKPSKSLHRMLSASGNPSMDNLAAIFAVIRKALGVNMQVHGVPTA